MKKPAEVIFTKFVQKQFKRLPERVQKSMRFWSEVIENEGVETMRRVPGYHDEPLKGDRVGQRSSRLNRSYRVIYEESDTGEILIISVLEVNKHEY
jgi:proteic killer suppression protein